MKKNRLYTVRHSVPAFMPDRNIYSLGSWVNNMAGKAGAWLGGDKMSAGTGAAVGALGSAIGQVGNSVIGGDYENGFGNAFANIGGTVGSALNTVNPLLGGIVSAGSGILGGAIRGLFGVKSNRKNIDFIKNNTAAARQIGRQATGASNTADLTALAGNMAGSSGFGWRDLYKNGLLTSKGTRMGNKLIGDENRALAYQWNAFGDAVDAVDQINDDNARSTFIAAYGGPLSSYGSALDIMQNDRYIDAINHRSNVMTRQNNMIRNTAWPSGSHAFGGELGTNGTDWTNGLLYVDAGGSHESNPLGGVPFGFDENGVPNLVEEGETVFNDYVFSNRMKVPKSMFHTLGLGGAMKKGITFADASKKLAKESEQRPNDPLSIDGLSASLAKLAAVQEAERMRKQMRQSAGLENRAAYGGSVNRFDDGGSLSWLNRHHPDIKNKEVIAAAMERYIAAHPSRIKLKGDPQPFINAYHFIADKGVELSQNTAAPNREKSIQEKGKKHFNELLELGIPQDIAFDLSFTEPQLSTRGGANNTYRQAANQTAYADSVEIRERVRKQLQDELEERNRLSVENTVDNPGEQPLQDNQAAVRQRTSAAFDSPIDTYNLESFVSRQTTPQASQRASSPSAAAQPAVSAGKRQGITPYAYDNGRWNEFNYYNPQTGQYDEGYLNFARNIGQDWVNRILAGNYGDMSRYLARNRGYDVSPQEVGSLATDHMYSDMHKAVAAAYEDYLRGMDPVTGEIREINSGEPNIMSAEEEAANRALQAKTPSGYPAPGAGDANPGMSLGDDGYTGEYEPGLLGTRLRYAPVIGSALSVFNDLLNPADYTYPDKLEAAAAAAGYVPSVRFNPISNYLTYRPSDRHYPANQLLASSRGTDRMLMNQNSPSRDAGLVANAYNTNIGLGNIYRQSDDANEARRAQVAGFNIRPEMFNSQMGLEAAVTNARNSMAARNTGLEGLARAAALRDAIDQRRGASVSANLTNFFNNLGNIGRENFIFNQINGDRSRGYYYDDPLRGGFGYKPASSTRRNNGNGKTD